MLPRSNDHLDIKVQGSSHTLLRCRYRKDTLNDKNPNIDRHSIKHYLAFLDSPAGRVSDISEFCVNLKTMEQSCFCYKEIGGCFTPDISSSCIGSDISLRERHRLFECIAKQTYWSVLGLTVYFRDEVFLTKENKSIQNAKKRLAFMRSELNPKEAPSPISLYVSHDLVEYILTFAD